MVVRLPFSAGTGQIRRLGARGERLGPRGKLRSAPNQVAQEFGNEQLDQLDLVDGDALDQESSADECDEKPSSTGCRPFNLGPISEVIPNAATVAELSLSLIQLSAMAMQRFAELLQVATGKDRCAPSHKQWKKRQTWIIK